jgi:hypothetical protein
VAVGDFEEALRAAGLTEALLDPEDVSKAAVASVRGRTPPAEDALDAKGLAFG